MELPTLFNEKITALVTLPLDAQIKWHYPKQSLFEKRIPCLPPRSWITSEFYDVLKPSDLNILHKFDMANDNILSDLKAKGTAKLKEGNYSFSFGNYQQLTLTDEVLDHLQKLPEELPFREFDFKALSPFAHYFEVTLDGKGISKRNLYVPMRCYNLFEDYLLPTFFSQNETSFIRNSLLEYLYYKARSAPTLPLPHFKPFYRILIETSFIISQDQSDSDMLKELIKGRN